MTNLPDVPMEGTLKALATTKDAAALAKLQNAASELVTVEGFPRPIPRWLSELPRSGDDGEVQARIAASVLFAPDPDKAQEGGGTEASKDMLNTSLTVWDLRISPSDKEGGVGCFAILDVTVGDEDAHHVMTTGAIQAIARLARAWAEDKLPVTGSFAAIEGTGSKGSPAITFLVERAF